jgi:hypothetical protein
MTATVVLSIIAGLSLLVSITIWRLLRATRRRLDDLSQSYWQLRYEIGELRVQLHGRSGTTDSAQNGAAEPPAQPRLPSGEAFVPLTSLKR